MTEKFLPIYESIRVELIDTHFDQRNGATRVVCAARIIATTEFSQDWVEIDTALSGAIARFNRSVFTESEREIFDRAFQSLNQQHVHARVLQV
jgi:hypothetical protein